MHNWGRRWRRTTLSGNDTAFTQGVEQQLEVGFLKQSLRRAFWVRTVGDDDVEFVLAVREELEAVGHVHCYVGVLEADAHSWEIFFGDADDGLYFSFFFHSI